MSLTFTQIQALIDRTCKTNSSSYSVADKTADVNLALDYVLNIIFKTSNTWQFDDSNYDDYPIITTDLVSGQRDYSYTTDNTGNLILDIYRVMIKGVDGVYRDVLPVSQRSEDSPITFADGLNAQGTPIYYDKTGNGIFLDPIPSYNSTAGLKIYINREASHFATTDTIKKSGIAGILHEYLALRPSYYYALRNGLPIAGGVMRNGARTGLLGQLSDMEKMIGDYYGGRVKDEPKRIRPRVDSTR